MKKLVCVLCPVGCPLNADIKGDRVNIQGNRCKKGIDFAQEELVAPRRQITTTLRMQDGRLLAVRTQTSIPKEKVFDVLAEARLIHPSAPVQCGQIIAQNIADTGVSLIASCDVP